MPYFKIITDEKLIFKFVYDNVPARNAQVAKNKVRNGKIKGSLHDTEEIGEKQIKSVRKLERKPNYKKELPLYSVITRTPQTMRAWYHVSAKNSLEAKRKVKDGEVSPYKEYVPKHKKEVIKK